MLPFSRSPCLVDTAYGGFKASLWTDNVQATVIMIFIIIGGAAIGTRIEISQERIDSSGLLTANRFGGQLFFILSAALIFSQMFNQGAPASNESDALRADTIPQASGSVPLPPRTTRRSISQSAWPRCRSLPSASSSA